MTRLTYRILETVERDGDAFRLTAGADSLGLSSTVGRTGRVSHAGAGSLRLERRPVR